MAFEPHFYIKAGMVGARRKYRGIMLGSRGMVANECLRDYWRPFFKIITNPIIELPMRPLAWMKPIRYELYPADAEICTAEGKQVKGFPAFDDVFTRYYDEYGNRPLIKLDREHQIRGRRALERLGLPRDAWFVSVHVREDGFISSPRTRHRNRDITDYITALDVITSGGGWVVRLGNPTMTRLPNLPKVIDYVFTDARSDWMDIFLLASCRFFLGSDSGPSVVPPLFGRQCAIVDGFPMGHGWWPGDLYIKKLYRSLSDDRLLSFPEILQSELRDAWVPDQWASNGIIPEENSPEEIANLTKEMMDRVEGVARYTEEDERAQRAYSSLLLSRTTPFTFGARSRIGRDFLRKYADLFEPPKSR